jgi:hypothetical protein
MTDRLERVARALCRADNKDPEKTYQTGAVESVRQGNAIVTQYVTAPLWKKYEPEAAKFIAVYEALREDD